MQAILLTNSWRMLPTAPSDTTNYAGWQVDDSAWYPIEVPQSAQSAIPRSAAAWFRCDFEMHPPEDCAAWFLEFEGADYRVEVWLNGQLVGEHAGFFDRFRFDVTHALHLETNLLALRLSVPKDDAVRGVLGAEALPWYATRHAGGAFFGGIWGQVALQAYPCDTPPNVDDWFAPLAAPIVRVDSVTGQWFRGDAPFFPRGSVYLPPPYLGQLSRADFERDVRLMKEANLNIVRVYAHVLPAAFYEICDEMGMLVWQDFPLYGSYPEDAAFASEALRQLERMVVQLGQYMCIAVWGVHTETPWLRDGTSNLALDQQLAERLQQLDPARYVYLESRGETFSEVVGLDWRSSPLLQGAALALVCNLPSLPEAAARLPEWLAQADIPPHMAAEVRNESDLIQANQRYHAQQLQLAIEYYRRRKEVGVTGVFSAFFVDQIEATSGAVLDVNRKPKRAYAALKNAMQPVLPLADLAGFLLVSGQELHFHVVVVNDLPERFSGWNCKVSMTGWIPSSQTQEATYMHHWNHVFRLITIEPCGLTDLGALSIPPLTGRASEYHLVLQLFNLEDESQRSFVNTYQLRVLH